MHDVKSIHDAAHFQHIREIVADTLLLFSRYDIHATWATVGLLHYRTISDLQADAPTTAQPYTNTQFSPFPLTTEKYGTFDPAVLLGRKEIQSILNQPNQELASHTFSHIYCAEEGLQATDFETDCRRMEAVANELNNPFQSIVFPRNQVMPYSLKICKKYGYKAFRGNQENRFWKNSSFNSESFLKKAGRVMDAYLRISGTKSYTLNELKMEHGLCNIPANRFFRAATTHKFLEKRKMRRIKNEMYKAAKKGTVYHLWWHPHNFLVLKKNNLDQLEELLAYFQVLKHKFGFDSLNLSEIAERKAP